MDESYLTDLDRCEPAEAVSEQGGPGTWRALPYKAEARCGTMLIAGDETSAQPVTYRMGRTGWHRLSLGLVPALGPVTIEVRLSGDDSATLFRYDPTQYGERAGHGDTIHELPWKDADLSGQDIIIAQISVPADTGQPQGTRLCEKAGIAWIRAVPLSENEARTVRRERAQRHTKRLYGHNDAHGYLFKLRPSTEAEIWRELEPYRDTDFRRMYWEAGMGDLLYYLGEKGRLCTCDPVADFYRQGDRLHAESWRAFRDTGLDPLRVAMKRCRELGLEFHAAYRTAGFYFPPPYDHWNLGGLYGKRPDLRSAGKDGSAAPRLSYAYPEVREYVIDLLLEVADIGVDGICLLYNRRPPLIDYDAPLVEAFQAEYGVDPRTLPVDDERWLEVKSRPLTTFMRDLRAALPHNASHITACVSNRSENRLHGMDVRAWIAEGLVDTLIPYTSAAGLDSKAESWPAMDEVEYFVELTRGSGCELSMSVLPRRMCREEYRRKAAALYRTGVESLFFWDSAGGYGRADGSPVWQEVCRLGHRDEVLAWDEAGGPTLEAARMDIDLLGGYDLSYQTPG